jgi:CHAT domain-containing protein/tetratricopeptide (TPR) repeat protein
MMFRWPKDIRWLIRALLVSAVFMPTASAQEARWRQLNDRVVQLYNKGRYEQAVAVAQDSVKLAEVAFGKNDSRVTTSLNNLGLLYSTLGRYGEAAPLLERALNIDLDLLGQNSPAVATDMTNLADVYWNQGKHFDAIKLNEDALYIFQRALGADNPDVATSLHNLAAMYLRQSDYARAKPLLERALAIDERTLGAEHPVVASDLSGLAELDRAQGHYDEAEPLLKRALRIYQESPGVNDADVADSQSLLARTYKNQGKYAEAEPLYKKAVEGVQKVLGPDSPSVAVVLDNLAFLYWVWHKPELAETYFEKAQAIHSKMLQKEFAYMREDERLLYLSEVSGAFSSYFSFCYSYQNQYPDLSGKFYDALLQEKGMVATSVASMRAKIARTGKRKDLDLLTELTKRRTEIARLEVAPRNSEEPARQIEQRTRLEKEARDLESALVKRSPAFASEKNSPKATWRDVGGKLKEGEAAVEFTRFNFNDGNGWTQKSYYAALIITPEMKIAPAFVWLGDAETLECGPVNDYRRLIGKSPTCVTCSTDPNRASTAPFAPTFYDAFWKPLKSALGDAKRIYISPDGVLNQVSFAVLSDGSGKLLIEQKYDLRTVLSTRDLLRVPHPSSAKTAVLIGDPLFDITDADQEKALAQLLEPQRVPRHTPASYSAQNSGGGTRGPSAGTRSLDLQTQIWEQREGTKIEVDELADLLRKKNWEVEKRTEADALEEAVKKVRGPRVLHMATHGFFLTDEDQAPPCGAAPTSAPPGLEHQHLKEDPMLRSGLVFTGANRIASGKPAPPGIDNGILTAYEAMGLDLEGTELVVLSACDTGLGETRAGEGVFGLRRAFQVAGAESILMTMWEVDDMATQELMDLFYEKWLGGNEKHEALRQAQLELHRRIKERATTNGTQVNDLALWGAFVLYGL